MLDLARETVGTQPILALFLAIGVGYLVGQINLGGFSLGVGAVLFVGLAIGAFAPKAQIVGPIGLTGLIMFLYGIGILYGRQFFEGMAGSAGIKANVIALIGVIAGLLVALGLGKLYGIQLGHTLGMFAGSMTSTATLQAALEVMKNSEPSIGYSIAYPFGVIGPILCIYFMTRQVQAEIPAQRRSNSTWARSRSTTSAAGRTLDDVITDLPAGVQVTMVRKDNQNVVPCGRDRACFRRRTVDHWRSTRKASLPWPSRLGRLEPGRIVKDRSSLDYIRVFVGKANAVGIPLSQLQMPAGFPSAYAARAALRHGHRADAGSDAGVRRSGRRADAARASGGNPQALRRYGQGYGRVQLRFARSRHGDGRRCLDSFPFRFPASASLRSASAAVR